MGVASAARCRPGVGQVLYRCSTDALPGFLRCWREYRRPLPEWRLWGCCERAGELLKGDKMPAGRPSQAAGRCGEKTESPVTSRVIAVVPRTSRCWPTDPFARCRRRLRSDTVRLSHGVVRPVSVPTGCQRDEERMSGWRRGIHSAPRGASFIPSAQNLSGRGPARATLPLLTAPVGPGSLVGAGHAGRCRSSVPRPSLPRPRSGGGGVRTKVRITSINASSR